MSRSLGSFGRWSALTLSCFGTVHCGDGSSTADVLVHDAPADSDTTQHDAVVRDGTVSDGIATDTADLDAMTDDADPDASADTTNRSDATTHDAGAMDAARTDATTITDARAVDAGAVDAGADTGTFHAPFDWVGVIGTGQSLSVGAHGTPIVDTTQPFHNLKLRDTGPSPQYPLDGGGVLSLVPLVEPIRPGLAGYADGQYPNNIAGETPHTAMANQITALARAAGAADYVTLHSVVGWSGHCLVDIDREGNAGVVGRAYPGSLSEARTFTRLAASMGHTFGYGAIILTHGECDALNTGYEDGVYRLYTDYNTDLRAITGQHTPVVLLVSQQSAGGPSPGNATLNGSMLAMWRAGVDHPGQIVCVGPKYQYQYYSDNLHLDAINYRRLGEKYAEVFDQIVNHGVAWHPLQPRTATRSGAVITVTFDVPDPPMAWEESLEAPHQTVNTMFAHGRGFEAHDSHGQLAIASVAIVGNAVHVTLTSPPTGTGLVVRYATTEDGATSSTHAGTVLGFRGQLRDSDPFVASDAQMIACQVATGSTAVTCPATSALSVRSVHDLVEGAGLVAGATVLTTDRATHATLSAPWTGAAGTVMLRFRSDQRNYCVHFELPVT